MHHTFLSLETAVVIYLKQSHSAGCEEALSALAALTAALASVGSVCQLTHRRSSDRAELQLEHTSHFVIF